MLLLQKCVEEVSYLESFILFWKFTLCSELEGDKAKETNYSSPDP